MRLLFLVLWLYLGALVAVFLERALVRSEPTARWMDAHPYPLGLGEPWNSMAVSFLLCLTGCVVGFFVVWNVLIAPRLRKRT